MNVPKKHTILVVDDEKANINVMIGLLKNDYRVLIAKSGEKALQVVSISKPDLILLDIMMPEMDGYEVCRRLKADEKNKNIPVVFISAKSEENDETKGLKLGAIDYITKPISPPIVLARIKIHLELKLAKEKLEKKFQEAKIANHQIMESIRYAGMIQNSLLPDPELIQANLPDSFYIWLPRDIVGGDIFFYDFFNRGMVAAVVDCTGHGVPGALMSMIASSGLRQIVSHEKCHDPAEILKKMNYFVKISLLQDASHAESDDGMDMSVCFFDKNEQTLIFSGARHFLFYTNENELAFIKGDRQSIGYKKSDLSFEFTNHHIKIQSDMNFYMASDGFTDQLGGRKRRSFGRKRFNKLLKENHQLPFDIQQKLLLEAFETYRGDNDRLDDVTVIGFNLNSFQEKSTEQQD